MGPISDGRKLSGEAPDGAGAAGGGVAATVATGSSETGACLRWFGKEGGIGSSSSPPWAQTLTDESNSGTATARRASVVFIEAPEGKSSGVRYTTSTERRWESSRARARPSAGYCS